MQVSFTFVPGVTVIVGQNTAGKTNLLDSIHLLSTGKSFVAEKDEELIRFGRELTRIKGTIEEEDRETTVEVLVTAESEMHRAGKRFFVNGVAKRRVDFISHLPTLLFTPIDLEIIHDGPSYRRNFLDQVLEQTDPEYKRSIQTYVKALRQRNALLEHAKETGIRNEKQFTYWNEILIQHGTYIHEQRQMLIDYINAQEKTVIQCVLTYDHSVISQERLEKYKDAELGAGVTLVGPHRDDVLIQMTNDKWPITNEKREAKLFGSRGQQRLIILQLKLLQLVFMKKYLGMPPLLLLDDIFSELDSGHIDLVSQMIGGHQTIITTTHAEFVNPTILQTAKVIELGVNNPINE